MESQLATFWHSIRSNSVVTNTSPKRRSGQINWAALLRLSSMLRMHRRNLLRNLMKISGTQSVHSMEHKV